MIKHEDIQEKFPFLSIVETPECDYVGIIQNSDDKIISIYDYGSIKTQEEKKLFLEYGEIWWWESNRLLPIYIFLNGEMRKFRYCLKTFPVKSTEIVMGPSTSLSNLQKKRVKKRQIQLIKKDT